MQTKMIETQTITKEDIFTIVLVITILIFMFFTSYGQCLAEGGEPIQHYISKDWVCFKENKITPQLTVEITDMSIRLGNTK